MFHGPTPFHQPGHAWYLNTTSTLNHHIRPYPLGSMGSRPLSLNETGEGQISTQVGDDWGILGVVCFSFVNVSSWIHPYLNSTSTLGSPCSNPPFSRSVTALHSYKPLLPVIRIPGAFERSSACGPGLTLAHTSLCLLCS